MSPAAALRSLFGFGRGQPRLWLLSPRQWAWLWVTLSAAFQIFLAELTELEFRQQADIGIFIQAITSNGNGRLFWATSPYLRFGTVSLLNVHFSWVVFAVYPIYTWIPVQLTLFVLQAMVLSLAALPLGKLASRISGSWKTGLLAVGLYLAWAPMYAGMPNSFHLEAFLPIEFFFLVLFWYDGRYIAGLLVAVMAGFTLDVAPILTGLIGVMFLTYPIEGALRLGLRAPRSEGTRAILGQLRRVSLGILRSRRV